MSTEIAKTESHEPKALVYKVTPEQIGNAVRRGINRLRVEVFRRAQITQRRARSAAKRLAYAITHADGPVDDSLIGLYRHMRRIADKRVVGPRYGDTRPGRRS